MTGRKKTSSNDDPRLRTGKMVRHKDVNEFVVKKC